jgi:ankyrin repeat protein
MCIDQLAPVGFDLVGAFLTLRDLVQIGACSASSRRLLAGHAFCHCAPAAPPALRKLWRSCSASGLALLWKLYGAHAPDARDRWQLVMNSCENGQLEKLQWLAAQGLIGPPDLHHRECSGVNALNTACGRGRLAVAQWLTTHFGCAADDTSFVWVCAGGHLATAQWLVARFGPRPHLDYVPIMQLACARGRAAVAAWLVAQFAGMSATPWYPRLQYLLAACEGGHLEVARLLVAPVGRGGGFDSARTVRLCELRAERRRGARRAATKLRRLDTCDRFTALAAACRYGHLEIAHLLVAEWQLTARDDPADYVHTMLCVACAHDHLRVVVWLADHFGLTPELMAVDNNYALRLAARNGHRKVAEWLTAQFGPSAPKNANGVL